MLGGKSRRFSREKKIAEESTQSGNSNDAAHSDGRGLLTDRFIIVRDSKTTSLLVVNSDELSFTCIIWEFHVHSQRCVSLGKWSYPVSNGRLSLPQRTWGTQGLGSSSDPSQ